MPLVNPRDFREASFAPRAAIDLRTLTGAVARYEELTGEEVDVDEAAIALAFKKLAEEELRLLIPLQANARADRLPPDVLADLEEYQEQLETVRNAASDDCVRSLAGEGASIKEGRDRVRQIRQALTAQGRETLRTARRAVEQMWPAFRLASADAPPAPDEASLGDVVQRLHDLLADRTFYHQLPAIQRDTRAIVVAYQRRYESLHAQRNGSYTRARDAVRNRPEWTDLAASVPTPLQSRICRRSSPRPGDGTNTNAIGAWTPVLKADTDTCPQCLATLGQMESDLAAVAGLPGQALARLQELTKPPEVERVERVRLSGFFLRALDSYRAVDEALARLREHLLRLISEGVEIVLE